MSLLVFAAIPMQRLMIKRRSADAPAAINIMQMTGIAGKVHRGGKRHREFGKAKGGRGRGKKTRSGSASGGRRSRSRSRRGDGGWMGRRRHPETRDWWQTLLKALTGWMLHHLARERGRRIQMSTRLNTCGPVPCVARTFLTYIPTLGKCANGRANGCASVSVGACLPGIGCLCASCPVGSCRRTPSTRLISKTFLMQ